MAYFSTSGAANAPPSTKHGWPEPADEAGVDWTCSDILPTTCAACSNAYDAVTAPDGDAGIVRRYCELLSVVEDEGSDLGGQDPGRLLHTVRQLQKLLSYFWWLGAGNPAADSTFEAEDYLFFTERQNLTVVSGGSTINLSLSREATTTDSHGPKESRP